MAYSMTDPAINRLMQGAQHIDEGLPVWARRTNPIVRRQLGLYWKTLPLETWTWLRLMLAQSLIILLALPFPGVYSFVMPIVTVSVLMIPFVIGLYLYLLMRVGSQAATAVYDEQRNNTLALLLITPLPLSHIIFSKIAASIWRQLDSLSMVMLAHVLLGTPLLILQYATRFNPREDAVLITITIIASIFISFLRLFLEPIMVGAIGAMVGAAASPRILAVIAANALAGSYFLMINLPRLMELDWPVRLLLELVLPLVLPLLIIWISLMITGRFLRTD